MIRFEIKKLQYDISRKEAKLSVLSSGKIVKHDYLTGEEISTSDQSRMTDEAKVVHFQEKLLKYTQENKLML